MEPHYYFIQICVYIYIHIQDVSCYKVVQITKAIVKPIKQLHISKINIISMKHCMFWNGWMLNVILNIHNSQKSKNKHVTEVILWRLSRCFCSKWPHRKYSQVDAEVRSIIFISNGKLNFHHAFFAWTNNGFNNYADLRLTSKYRYNFNCSNKKMYLRIWKQKYL